MKMGRGVGACNKQERIEAQVLFHGRGCSPKLELQCREMAGRGSKGRKAGRERAHAEQRHGSLLQMHSAGEGKCVRAA